MTIGLVKLETNLVALEVIIWEQNPISTGHENYKGHRRVGKPNKNVLGYFGVEETIQAQFSMDVCLFNAPYS